LPKPQVEGKGLTKKITLDQKMNQKLDEKERLSESAKGLLSCGSAKCRPSFAHAASQARIYGLTTGVVDWQQYEMRSGTP
jgi:hypothetical protein